VTGLLPVRGLSFDTSDSLSFVAIRSCASLAGVHGEFRF